jgi:hypothetical protein
MKIKNIFKKTTKNIKKGQVEKVEKAQLENVVGGGSYIPPVLGGGGTKG